MSRSLWPREHGAYAQLLAPLVTALVVMPPTWQAALLALAACSAFMANEPLLVVLGHRGKRLRDSDGARAKRRLALLVAIAAVAGAVGLAASPQRVLEVAGVVAVPALATILLAWRRAEKSVVGEIVAVIALSGASAVVLVASGASWQTAGTVWAAWAIGYACTVIAVHRVIARHRKPAAAVDAIAGIVLAAISTATIALLVEPVLCADAVARLGDPRWFAATPAALSTIGAAAPLAVASLLLVLRPPRATYLRTIGFVLVGASLLAGALAIVMLR